MSNKITEFITVSETFPVDAKKMYEAWLDSETHSKFTGGAAKIDPTLGGAFTAWDDYISGKNLELHPNTVIVQSWRATDFPEGAEDSILKVIFEEIEAETKITINHTNIPESMVNDYKQGWLDYYFKPMKEYFK